LTEIFYSVTLSNNLETLGESIPFFLNKYGIHSYWIVCPESDQRVFSEKFSNNLKVKIVSESEIISFTEFSKIFESIQAGASLSKRNYSESIKRLKWYYQQVLKISFIEYIKLQDVEFSRLVMFDADSLPLKRIRFFNANGESILYGSLTEAHQSYITPLPEIFKDTKINYLHGFTVQFFSCNLLEMQNVKNAILQSRFSKNALSYSEKVSFFILMSTLEAHGTLAGSGFSEQEFIGFSNMNSYKSTRRQKLILALRCWNLRYQLRPSQYFFLRALGFSLITYENRSSEKQKTLDWINFFALVIKAIKHQMIFYLHACKNQQN